jgi:hypothetical protein
MKKLRILPLIVTLCCSLYLYESSIRTDFENAKGRGLSPISGAFQSTNALTTWHKRRFSPGYIVEAMDEPHYLALLSYGGRVLLFPPYYFS